MKKSIFLSVIALIFSAAALFLVYFPCNKNIVRPMVSAPVSSDAIEEILNNKPEIVINALQKYEENMRAQAAAQAKEKLKTSTEALNNDPSSPFIGPKDAKLVLVEFYDYACHFCHQLYPELNKVVANNPDVKFVFKPLAFVSPYSDYAGRAAFAAAKQGKFSELHTAMFTVEGGLNEEVIDDLAAKAGLDMDQFKKDIQSEEASAAMNSNSGLASQLQINGVPTMVFDGDFVQTLSADDIQSKIDAAKK